MGGHLFAGDEQARVGLDLQDFPAGDVDGFSKRCYDGNKLTGCQFGKSVRRRNQAPSRNSRFSSDINIMRSKHN